MFNVSANRLAASKIGIETTSFIAILGTAGFTLGLALQGSLSISLVVS
jgi:small conductance mechanosensitive channel